MPPTPEALEQLQAEWTDRRVAPHPERPELARFLGRVGRVVTVNHSGRALVDFGDGGWYDLPADPGWLVAVTDPEAIRRYDATRNRPQPRPDRQG